MDDITTERSFDSQATWSIDAIGLFLEIFHGRLYNQTLEDVRSNDADIECLYCSIWVSISKFNPFMSVAAEKKLDNWLNTSL